MNTHRPSQASGSPARTSLGWRASSLVFGALLLLGTHAAFGAQPVRAYRCLRFGCREVGGLLGQPQISKIDILPFGKPWSAIGKVYHARGRLGLRILALKEVPVEFERTDLRLVLDPFKPVQEGRSSRIDQLGRQRFDVRMSIVEQHE